MYFQVTSVDELLIFCFFKEMTKCGPTLSLRSKLYAVTVSVINDLRHLLGSS